MTFIIQTFYLFMLTCGYYCSTFTEIAKINETSNDVDLDIDAATTNTDAKPNRVSKRDAVSDSDRDLPLVGEDSDCNCIDTSLGELEDILNTASGSNSRYIPMFNLSQPVFQSLFERMFNTCNCAGYTRCWKNKEYLMLQCKDIIYIDKNAYHGHPLTEKYNNMNDCFVLIDFNLTRFVYYYYEYLDTAFNFISLNYIQKQIISLEYFDDLLIVICNDLFYTSLLWTHMTSLMMLITIKLHHTLDKDYGKNTGSITIVRPLIHCQRLCPPVQTINITALVDVICFILFVCCKVLNNDQDVIPSGGSTPNLKTPTSRGESASSRNTAQSSNEDRGENLTGSDRHRNRSLPRNSNAGHIRTCEISFQKRELMQGRVKTKCGIYKGIFSPIAMSSVLQFLIDYNSSDVTDIYELDNSLLENSLPENQPLNMIQMNLKTKRIHLEFRGLNDTDTLKQGFQYMECIAVAAFDNPTTKSIFDLQRNYVHGMDFSDDRPE